MKNIYLLQTDKPSRLWTNNLRRRLELDEFPSQHPSNIAKHLYITSDEVIKEGDYVFNLTSRYVYSITELWEIVSYERKIILTTDQELIADGVQAIDEDFLNWFVENPTCEEVKMTYENDTDLYGCDFNYYKITIPKEKPKNVYKMPLAVNNVTMSCTNKPKKTLEEESERIYPKHKGLTTVASNKIMLRRAAWIEGAKWQQEQDRWKTVSEETPPSNIELLVKSDNGIVHLSSWRESYHIFSCQDKRESSLDWQWKKI